MDSYIDNVVCSTFVCYNGCTRRNKMLTEDIIENKKRVKRLKEVTEMWEKSHAEENK